MFELLGDKGDNFIFAFLWVLDNYGIVDLQEKLARAFSPDLEHAGVYDVGKTALRIVRNSLPERGVI